MKEVARPRRAKPTKRASRGGGSKKPPLLLDTIKRP
nr:MAG TPA: hypothetical protein [Caudoviricetes sp.]